MKKKNLVLSLILIGICIIFYLMTFQLPSNTRLYPLFTATLLLILSLILLITDYFKRTVEDVGNTEEINIKQLLFVIGSSGLYVVLISIIGYVTSTLAYLLVVLFGLDVDKGKGSIVGIGFTAFIYILFKVVLNVPLPTGLII